MVHYSRVINGLLLYIENEMAAKLAGSWKAWGLRVLASMAAGKAEDLYHQIASKPLATTIGLIDGENVNVDGIIGELRKVAQNSSATIDIPMIGPYTVGIADIDALNRYIRG